MVKRLFPLFASLVVPAFAVAQSNEGSRGWDGPGPWHMWSGGWGFGWMFPLFMLVFFAVCIFFVVGHHGRSRHSQSAPTDSALQILSERFARGEINKDEYEEKKATLLR